MSDKEPSLLCDRIESLGSSQPLRLSLSDDPRPTSPSIIRLSGRVYKRIRSHFRKSHFDVNNFTCTVSDLYDQEFSLFNLPCRIVYLVLERPTPLYMFHDILVSLPSRIYELFQSIRSTLLWLDSELPTCWWPMPVHVFIPGKFFILHPSTLRFLLLLFFPFLGPLSPVVTRVSLLLNFFLLYCCLNFVSFAKDFWFCTGDLQVVLVKVSLKSPSVSTSLHVLITCA